MKTLLLIFTMLLAMSAYGQDQSKELILDYVDEMSRVMSPEEGEVYFLHMLMRNTYRQQVSAPKFIETKAYVSDQKVLLNSSLYSMFVDTLDAFTIIPSTKQVIRQDGISSGGDVSKKNYTHQLQLDIVKQSEVVSSTNVKNTLGEECKEIVLKPAADFREQMKIKSIKLIYNQALRKISEVRLVYLEESPIVEQVIEYRELNFDAKTDLGSEPVWTNVLNEAGELLDKYETYTLINDKKSRNNEN